MTTPVNFPGRELEQQRQTAMLAGDVPALNALLADSLVYVHSTGARDSKQSYLEKIEDKSMRYLSLQFDDIEAVGQESVGIVTGKMSATVLKDGAEKTVRSYYMTVWVRQNGSWVMQAHQGTPRAA